MQAATVFPCWSMLRTGKTQCERGQARLAAEVGSGTNKVPLSILCAAGILTFLHQ